MTASAALADYEYCEPLPSAAFANERLLSTPYSGTASPYVLHMTTPNWLDHVRSYLDELGRLSEGWNSYGARPVKWSARQATLELLKQIATRNTPQPAIIPTSDGSIQIEWHTRDIDLEVRVLSTAKISVSFEDLQNLAAPIDDELEYDYRSLVQAIQILSSR